MVMIDDAVMRRIIGRMILFFQGIICELRELFKFELVYSNLALISYHWNATLFGGHTEEWMIIHDQSKS